MQTISCCYVGHSKDIDKGKYIKDTAAPLYNKRKVESYISDKALGIHITYENKADVK